MERHVDSIHPIGLWKNTKPIDLSVRRKKPLLVLFWRSHTPQSVEALHALDNFVRKFERFPIDVLAVHAPEFQQHPDPWEEVIEQFNINLPVMHDPDFHTWERFGVQHAPSYVVLDEDGKETLRRVGSLDDSGIAEYVYSLL